MRQFLASIFTLLLTGSIALGLDAQTKAEIDVLITYVQTSGVRFIRNGMSDPEPRARSICATNSPRPVSA